MGRDKLLIVSMVPVIGSACGGGAETADEASAPTGAGSETTAAAESQSSETTTAMDETTTTAVIETAESPTESTATVGIGVSTYTFVLDA